MKKFLKTVGITKSEKDRLIGQRIVVGEHTIQIDSHLGEGGNATIYKVVDVLNGAYYALKHVRLCAEGITIRAVQHEVQMMLRFRDHPGVLRLLAVAYAGPKGNETDSYLLLDYCPITLLSVLQKNNFKLDDLLIFEVFSEVCNAVAYMHTSMPPVAHRDIKAENILRTSNGRWVLCDFGSATSRAQVYCTPMELAAEEENITRNTTPAYRAPEMWDLLQGYLIDTKVDVWALGILLYVLCYGCLPFQGDSKLAVLQANVTFPSDRPNGFETLIRELLTPNPDERPDILTVLSKLHDLKQSIEMHSTSPPAELSPLAAAVTGPVCQPFSAAAAAAPHRLAMPVVQTSQGRGQLGSGAPISPHTTALAAGHGALPYSRTHHHSTSAPFHGVTTALHVAAGVDGAPVSSPAPQHPSPSGFLNNGSSSNGSNGASPHDGLGSLFSRVPGMDSWQSPTPALSQYAARQHSLPLNAAPPQQQEAPQQQQQQQQQRIPLPPQPFQPKFPPPLPPYPVYSPLQYPPQQASPQEPSPLHHDQQQQQQQHGYARSPSGEALRTHEPRSWQPPLTGTDAGSGSGSGALQDAWGSSQQHPAQSRPALGFTDAPAFGPPSPTASLPLSAALSSPVSAAVTIPAGDSMGKTGGGTDISPAAGKPLRRDAAASSRSGGSIVRASTTADSGFEAFPDTSAFAIDSGFDDSAWGDLARAPERPENRNGPASGPSVTMRGTSTSGQPSFQGLDVSPGVSFGQRSPQPSPSNTGAGAGAGAAAHVARGGSGSVSAASGRHPSLSPLSAVGVQPSISDFAFQGSTLVYGSKGLSSPGITSSPRPPVPVNGTGSRDPLAPSGSVSIASSPHHAPELSPPAWAHSTPPSASQRLSSSNPAAPVSSNEAGKWAADWGEVPAFGASATGGFLRQVQDAPSAASTVPWTSGAAQEGPVTPAVAQLPPIAPQTPLPLPPVPYLTPSPSASPSAALPPAAPTAPDNGDAVHGRGSRAPKPSHLRTPSAPPPHDLMDLLMLGPTPPVTVRPPRQVEVHAPVNAGAAPVASPTSPRASSAPSGAVPVVSRPAPPVPGTPATTKTQLMLDSLSLAGTTVTAAAAAGPVKCRRPPQAAVHRRTNSAGGVLFFDGVPSSSFGVTPTRPPMSSVGGNAFFLHPPAVDGSPPSFPLCLDLVKPPRRPDVAVVEQGSRVLASQPHHPPQSPQPSPHPHSPVALGPGFPVTFSSEAQGVPERADVPLQHLRHKLIHLEVENKELGHRLRAAEEVIGKQNASIQALLAEVARLKGALGGSSNNSNTIGH